MKKWLKRFLLIFGILILWVVLFSGYWLVFGEGRYYFYLPAASKIYLKIGAIKKAETYAYEMLSTAETEKEKPCNWNYGNAIHSAHNILGRVALLRGDIDAAKKHLLLAGKTIGSPQLDTFGPNMVLAQELLKCNESETVLEYLDLCKLFWEMDNGKLDRWKAEIDKGQMPDFGANLWL